MAGGRALLAALLLLLAGGAAAARLKCAAKASCGECTAAGCFWQRPTGCGDSCAVLDVACFGTHANWSAPCEEHGAAPVRPRVKPADPNLTCCMAIPQCDVDEAESQVPCDASELTDGTCEEVHMCCRTVFCRPRGAGAGIGGQQFDDVKPTEASSGESQDLNNSAGSAAAAVVLPLAAATFALGALPHIAPA